MDRQSLAKLKEIGLASSDGIDIGGHGGTNWAWIEGLRGDERSRRLAGLFRELGVSTAESIENFNQVFANNQTRPSVIATGGIRSGLDIAKAVFLGAQSCGVGLPLFRAAMESPEQVQKELDMLAEELRATFFVCDAGGVKDLQKKKNLQCAMEIER